MKDSRKRRILSAIGAVLCAVSMIVSVAVLPGVAYASVMKNPLFAAALAAVTENNKSQNKSGEGGAGNKEGAKGGVVKGETDNKKETKGEVKGETGKNNNVDNKVTDNKVGNGNSENPNGGGSVDKNNSGNGAGKTAGNGADKGKDKSDKANGKAAKKDAKKDGKDKKAKDQDRSTGAMEKLTLDQVQKLPACVAEINEDNTKVTIKSPSGEAKCAISANEKSDAFDAIREKIESLPAGDGKIDFVDGVKAYGYGSLSKDKEGLFSGANVSHIRNGKNFDVSNVTDMSYLFKDSSLSVDFFYVNFYDPTSLIGWDVSKVTNMESMFEGCARLQNPKGMRDWNVSNVTNMKNMFEGCTGLENLSGLEGWDVSNVGSMSGMFASIIKDQDQHDALNPGEGYAGEMAIASVEPLSKWNVGNVMNMNRMFEGCTSITDFTDLEDWDTKNVEEMSGMFEYCKSMSSLKFLEKWNVSNVKDMMVMFALCYKIKNTKGLENWNVSNVKKMDGMFAYCSKLNSISGLSNWNKTGKSSTDQLASTFRMFYGCSFLTSLQPLRGWNVGSVENMSSMFDGCGSLTSLEPLEKWNVDNVTDMSSMFSSCNSLTSLQPLSGWAKKVGNVTDMSSMFNGCNSLTSLQPLSGWNVGSVTKMSSMFSGCHSLSNLKGLEKWNVGSVENMGSMFSDCYFDHTNKKGDVVKITGLTDISALSGWNVGSVTNMFNMFSGCTRLGNLKGLEGWNVSNVTNMSSMFSDCKKLTGAADLSKWDISKVTDFTLMFSNAGAESGDSLVLDFSNKKFTKPTNSKSTTVSVDGMFGGFKGTLIANNLQSSGFESNPDDDPIQSNFATGGIFSFDEEGHSDNIVVTDNRTIIDTISADDDLKNIKYYKIVHADIKPDDDSFPDTAVAKFTFSLPAIYDSTDVEACKKPDGKDKNNDKYDSVACAKAVLKKHFLGDFTEAIKAKRSKYPEITNIFSIWYYKKVETTDPAGSCTTYPKDKTPNCKWYTVNDKEGNGLDLLLKDAKSPVAPFNTLYYLEMLSRPVPLPHTGGQSAIMFTFLSIGLFSMFAVAGAFGRHGWVASVLPSTALTGFAKAFSGGALDVASGAKHCFANSVVSGSMLKTAVSAATGFFARFRTDDSTFGKHTKQR